MRELGLFCANKGRKKVLERRAHGPSANCVSLRRCGCHGIMPRGCPKFGGLPREQMDGEGEPAISRGNLAVQSSQME